jgi:hypothetical protein
MDDDAGLDAFENFLYAAGAARKLLERAHGSGFLIEAIVVYVSLIDGLLRIALVLDKQLGGDPYGDIDAYIQQVTGGPKFTEKAIYQEAHRRGLIDDALRDEIIELYEKRNAMIHRFFLSGMTYTSLGSVLDRYESVYDRCYKMVYDLEERQIDSGKGMTVVAKQSADHRDAVRERVKLKLGFDPGF